MAPLHRARVRVIQPAQLAYGPVEGLPELRRAVAAYIRVSRGVRCETGQVFITDGTQSSLELCARMLANPGEYGWLENPATTAPEPHSGRPGWARADRGRPRRHGAKRRTMAHPAAPADLYDTVAPVPARRADGPVGARRSSSARACGAWIIEDDYDSEFRHGGQPLPRSRASMPTHRSAISAPSARRCFPPSGSASWWYRRRWSIASPARCANSSIAATRPINWRWPNSSTPASLHDTCAG